MRFHVTRYTKGLTRWGVFHNLSDPQDRREFGWFVHIHTPAFQVQMNRSTDGFRATFR